MMAQVLAAVPVHGLDAVLVTAELALEAAKPSGKHVLNVLAWHRRFGDSRASLKRLLRRPGH